MRKNQKESITPAAVAAMAKGELGNAMAAMLPGGIERQEAEGQRMESEQAGGNIGFFR